MRGSVAATKIAPNEISRFIFAIMPTIISAMCTVPGRNNKIAYVEPAGNGRRSDLPSTTYHITIPVKNKRFIKTAV